MKFKTLFLLVFGTIVLSTSSVSALEISANNHQLMTVHKELISVRTQIENLKTLLQSTRNELVAVQQQVNVLSSVQPSNNSVNQNSHVDDAHKSDDAQVEEKGVVGGGNCTPYFCDALQNMTCGGSPGCSKITWDFWGAGRKGGCSKGRSTYVSGGTSFSCIVD